MLSTEAVHSIHEIIITLPIPLPVAEFAELSIHQDDMITASQWRNPHFRYQLGRDTKHDNVHLLAYMSFLSRV
jgi:hypothetical protein